MPTMSLDLETQIGQNAFPQGKNMQKSVDFMDHPASEAQLDTFLWFLNLKMFCLHGYNPLKIMSNFQQEITYTVQKSKCHEKLFPFTIFPYLPLL